MPEGPEVRVTTVYMDQTFGRCKLKDIEILSGRYLLKKGDEKKSSKIIDNLKEFKKELPLKIEKFNCKGKFLYWEIEGDWYIFVTLGLKGRISVGDNMDHNRVHFSTSCGSFYLRDSISNGTINIYHGRERLDKKLKNLGVDLLRTEMKDKEVVEIMREKFKRKKKKGEFIADLLLDQKYLAGVGNYIRADGLYCAKISPFKKFIDLTDIELERLIGCIRKIMKKSLDIQLKRIKKNFVYEKVAPSYKPLVYFRNMTDKSEKVVCKKMKFQNRTIWYVPEVQK